MTIATVGADAIIADEVAERRELSNRIARRDGFVATASAMGEEAAKGALGLLDLGVAFLEGVIDGFVNEDDAERVYGGYVAGHNAHMLAHSLGGEKLLKSGKDAGASVSMFKNFGKAVPVREGVELFKRVATLRATIEGEKRSLYQSIVSVCRDATKAWEAAGSPEGDAYAEWSKVITDEFIVGCCQSKAPPSKDEIQKMIEAVAKAAKLADANPAWKRLADTLSLALKQIDKAKNGTLSLPGSGLVSGKVEAETPSTDAPSTDAAVDKILADAQAKAKKVRVLDAVS